MIGVGVVSMGETRVVGTTGVVVVSTGVDGSGVGSTGTMGVVTGLGRSQYVVINAAICSAGTKWSSTRRGLYRLAW